MQVGDLAECGAVQEMKVWPFGAAQRGEASNHPKLRWLKTVVVSVEEKARGEHVRWDREGERKRTAVDVSKQTADIKTERLNGAGMSLAGTQQPDANRHARLRKLKGSTSWP
jgi:hypothetical protein